MYTPVLTYRTLLAFLAILATVVGLFITGNAQRALPHEVPVLCYHQVREYTKNDGKEARAITVTPGNFAAHMKMLADSGFTPILPDDLFAGYTKGIKLPSRPVIITFDDNTLSQYQHALPVLNKYHFKAVFFVMTVSIGKSNFMTKTQLQQLQAEGHVIAAHTWDHHKVSAYKAPDWKIQLDQPFHSLQVITGKPVKYFAYPYGVWTQTAIDSLQNKGVRMAFILQTKSDDQRPMYTIRRLGVGGSWAAPVLLRNMKSTFYKH
jgi:peptidoglycan/xylan/chitin deacetylase (PgdA/CDA1 family)